MIDSSDKRSQHYQQAGVNLEAAQDAVDRIKPIAQKTQRPGVVSSVGGFGGLFSLMGAGFIDNDQTDVLLVAGTDGIGTKLKLAFELNEHGSIGIDCVAMCVNDIITTGAQPLFFLDYIATGKLQPGQIAQIVEGIAQGCLQSGCALLGGETAEMPGFYARGEYDVAGFSLGAMHPTAQFQPTDIQPGDALIGLASTGIHSNGYSLVRNIVETHQLDLHATYESLGSAQTLGEILLAPTQIYVNALNSARQAGKILGAAHITGGGLYENIPRMLPSQCGAVLDESSWHEPAIFAFLSEYAKIPREEQRHVFNLGIGMVLACSQDDVSNVMDAIHKKTSIECWQIGEVLDQPGVVFRDNSTTK